MPYLVPMDRDFYYVCVNDGCPFQGRVRQVWARRLGDGMVEIPRPRCECSPDREMKSTGRPSLDTTDLGEQFSQWVVDEGLIGSEPCS